MPEYNLYLEADSDRLAASLFVKPYRDGDAALASEAHAGVSPEEHNKTLTQMWRNMQDAAPAGPCTFDIYVSGVFKCSMPRIL